MPTSTPSRSDADRQPRPIAEIARELGLAAEEWIPYGHDKAKVRVGALAARRDRPDGKLVVVSSITPTPAGDGKTTMTIGSGPGALAGRRPAGDRAARAVHRAHARHEGRRHRGRQVAGGADGRDQPPLHRRLPRDHLGAQPARRRHRQPSPPRQPARHRRPPGGVEADPRRQRPRPARRGGRARRAPRRRAARGGVPHHLGLRDHGRALPGRGPDGSQAAPRPHAGRADRRRQAGDRRRARGDRRDDRAAARRHPPEPGADDGGHARARARRAVRQHRPRLQLGAGHPARAQARRHLPHRGGLRHRPGRREVLRHQVPARGAPSPTRP